MSAEKRQPLDLLDKIYSLGYWMTGSLKGTNELVFRTYQNITSNASEIEVFKTFRDVYFDYASLNEAPPNPLRQVILTKICRLSFASRKLTENCRSCFPKYAACNTGKYPLSSTNRLALS
ncbi:MAG: hypothetical protein K9I59_05400 [Chlorobium sp.]|uniref:hypothetical protein n=1 Tax=Chlorobium sp. TaxID=1095 RepID=UPI0025C00121|nr:hypothetical protein [Chlorobium sp.]MCF8216211.1 hypothetical protein [Chlorobium sp.]MCF8271113.1 hypothetical protein [Chlorobium sp.]MCF8287487.1 hypothetical protein [Chlorobium sp.]MCF8291026.1 hypothetical protein [Chlorobium sp.]MCF8385121.1 hypothetical protein [Chlorobium sp.]